MTLSVPLMIIGIIACLSLLLCLRSIVVTRSLKGELKDLRQKINTENKPSEEKVIFSESLNQVERKAVPVAESVGNHADKYRYVASLADQGVDAAGIASALQMAPAEVEQLMRLARVKKQVLDVEH
jgi:uncharacterized membrane protein